MILKLMSGEDLPDDDCGKGCRIVDQVREANYYTNEPTQEKIIIVTYETPNRSLLQETFTLYGNAYLMNDNGKTLQSYRT